MALLVCGLLEREIDGFLEKTISGREQLGNVGAHLARAALEKDNIEYILGVRERSMREIRTVVINDDGVAVPLLIPRHLWCLKPSWHS
jgi:hypothetical protein